MDLFTFPPVCLPGQDESFTEKEGRVYGKSLALATALSRLPCPALSCPALPSPGWGQAEEADDGISYTSDTLREVQVGQVQILVCLGHHRERHRLPR